MAGICVCWDWDNVWLGIVQRPAEISEGLRGQ